jgi:quercetin dioxygenase-like cupin family protein
VTPGVRRVVTGHNLQGKAIVTIEDTLPLTSRRPGQEGCVVWAVDRIPVDNLDPAAEPPQAAGTTMPNGAVFRIVRYCAGMTGRMHRTDSIDYAVLLSGSIVLELDSGAEVTLAAGDVLVQRGTAHNWINRGTEPCTIAFVLIDALPIPVDSSVDSAGATVCEERNQHEGRQDHREHTNE